MTSPSANSDFPLAEPPETSSPYFLTAVIYGGPVDAMGTKPFRAISHVPFAGEHPPWIYDKGW